MLGLYLHIPFCSSICHYCNFNRGLYEEALKTRYVAAMEREIAEAGTGQVADTIFFGGGTPSLLDPGEIERLINACRDAYQVTPDAEITLETNPETVTPERLDGFRRAGVNRLSFGVQSFAAAELARLGRIHDAARAAEVVGRARTAGFDNVSIDLMCWLPGQTPPSWSRTVARAIEIDPDHLSAYILELYPNAPLRDIMARAVSNDAGVSWSQAPDDEAADMYLAGLEALDAAGYRQYEISNVAKPGRESRHNLKYWRSGAWRGFGCGAHSTLDRQRWRNVSASADYIDRVGGGRDVGMDHHTLSPGECIEEALFTGLRLSAGVNRRDFAAGFGLDPWLRYGESLAPYVTDELVWISEEGFGLTRRGMLVANEILSVFV